MFVPQDDERASWKEGGGSTSAQGIFGGGEGIYIAPAYVKTGFFQSFRYSFRY